MMSTNRTKGVIGILTGGGDVPGLNPAIRAITLRALGAGYGVVGIRRGWAGLVDLVRDPEADNSDCVMPLNQELVNRAARSGGTFLHTSRTNPGKVRRNHLPDHLAERYSAEENDLTDEVLANLDFLGIDHLIPIGGDDTLSYGVRLFQEGFKVVGIPKTMDNDVPGTDYCIGFSTCVTRTIEMTNQLRTSAGSHERFLVLEVFGRYAGFTALLPTLAGAAHRCIIPEHRFDMERLTELLVADRRNNPSRYAVLLVSEGSAFEGSDMVFESRATDAYGHAKLGGIGDLISDRLKELSAGYNNGRPVATLNQKLGYLARSGNPDGLDSVVPMVYGNLAMDLIESSEPGRLVALREGRYDSVPIDVVTSRTKTVDVERDYDRERLRPRYDNLFGRTMLSIGRETGS